MQDDRELIARLDELTVFGIREHLFHRPLHMFVTIAIDGDQQLQTEPSEDTLTPKWRLGHGYKLMVRASSKIKFTVYRQHRFLSKLGNESHCCGEVEVELQALLTDPYMHHPLTLPWYSMDDKLEVRVSMHLEPAFEIGSMLDHAGERLASKDWEERHERSSTARKSIAYAIENLEQVVQIMDGIVEIHPLCKVAWAVLSSVYKAFKDEHALDEAVRALAIELRETLAYARECKDLKAIPEATDVIHDIAKLVVESAAVFDQHVKYNIAAKAAIASVSKAHHKRVSACDEKLKILRKKLTETLVIRIWQGQNRLLERSGLAENVSRTSLTSISTTSLVPDTPLYTPPEGWFRDGYSPTYLSVPEDACRHKPRDAWSYGPPKSPQPTRVSRFDDSIRYLTASPDRLDPSGHKSRSSSRTRYSGQKTSVASSPASPFFPPVPLSSRNTSFASYTTDGGRTLSTRSSRSSLRSPCDQFDSHPAIQVADDDNPLDEYCHDSCAGLSKCSLEETEHVVPMPKIVMPVPIPMSWSQLNLISR